MHQAVHERQRARDAVHQAESDSPAWCETALSTELRVAQLNNGELIARRTLMSICPRFVSLCDAPPRMRLFLRCSTTHLCACCYTFSLCFARYGLVSVVVLYVMWFAGWIGWVGLGAVESMFLWWCCDCVVCTIAPKMITVTGRLFSNE